MWDDTNVARDPDDRARAHAPAKTATMLFAVELDRRLGSRGARAFGIQPGVVTTHLHRHLTREIIARLSASWWARN